MKIVIACTIFLVLAVVISSVECRPKRRSTDLELEDVDDKIIEIITKRLKRAPKTDKNHDNGRKCKDGQEWDPEFQECVLVVSTNGFGNPGFGGKK